MSMKQNIYLFGVRVSPDSPDPEFFTLFRVDDPAVNEVDQPVMAGEYLAFFRRPEHASAEVSRFGLTPGEIPTEVTYIYDIPEVIYRVRHADHDPEGIVVEFVNRLLDAVGFTGKAMPPAQLRLLRQLADSLTFATDFGFLAADPRRRTKVLDAIFWSLGAIVASCVVIPLREPGAIDSQVGNS
jgi:hypothetical protein